VLYQIKHFGHHEAEMMLNGMNKLSEQFVPRPRPVELVQPASKGPGI